MPRRKTNLNLNRVKRPDLKRSLSSICRHASPSSFSVASRNNEPRQKSPVKSPLLVIRGKRGNKIPLHSTAETNVKLQSQPSTSGNTSAESPVKKVPRINLFLEDLTNNLLTGSKEENEAEKMTRLIPVVLQKLHENDTENVFLDCFRLIAEDKFPLDNIAFRLWMDIVRWYRCDNVSSMRYEEETKKFWKLGWRLSGGKFVRFMSGFKHTSLVAMGDVLKVVYKPSDSDVNFAVPDVNVLRSFTPFIQNEITSKPGIHVEVMSRAAEALENTSACLSFDGKKLKQGLTQHFGDVDLLGFEAGIPLAVRQNVQERDLDLIDMLLGDLDSIASGSENLADINSLFKEKACIALKTVLTILGGHAQECRLLREKKVYAREKMKERSGSNWREGKYVYAISALSALLYEIDQFLKTYTTVIENICCTMSILRGSLHVLPLAQVFLYLNVRITYHYPNTLNLLTVGFSNKDHNNGRNQARVTGSTLHTALGLDGLKRQQEQFDKVICKIPEKEKSSEVRANLEYGIRHEIHAVATLVSKVLPALYPGLAYHEEGFCSAYYDGNPFLVVSPDGSLKTKNDESEVSRFGVEIKCPVKSFTALYHHTTCCSVYQR